MSLPPWLETPPPPLLAQDELPARVDVAVVGGGLAGLSAACWLARGGAAVGLLEGREQLAGGFSTRAPGLVLAGLGEHPGRLVASIGAKAARQVHAFLAENRALLAELGLLRRSGSLSVGAMEGEGEEITRTLDVLPALGVPCRGLSAEEVDARLAAQGLGPGRLVEEDGLVDPVDAACVLAAQARAAGAKLRPGAPVTAMDDAEGGWTLRAPGITMQADVVVLAAGHGLRALVPWFRDTVHPVRHQWIATAPVHPDRLPLPVLGQHGFSHWLQVGGRIVAGGARFGTPQMEVDQVDDGVLQPRIDHILRRNLARFFPDLAAVPVTHAWAAIAAHSCDGLPLVGPLPGRGHLVACTAFHALDHGVALRAGQAVAQGLLTGLAPGVPRLFTPARLL